MMLRNPFLFAFMMLALLTTIPACHQKSSDAPTAEMVFAECVGDIQYAIMDTLYAQFKGFLADNGFCKGEEDLLDGYKGYLRFLLQRQGLDTHWVFRTQQLELMMADMEQHHFAEYLYAEKLLDCVLRIDYPEDYLMASYKMLMPQHTVSPEQFATSFIEQVDKEQFKDPVLRRLVALEYFLGPVIYQLRPDEHYFAHNSH